VGVDDAEDVAQEAFLRAFHRLDQYRGDAPFRAWLLRIAHNTALNEAERRKAHESLDDEANGEPQLESRERPPSEELEVAERRERLARKLTLIQPTHRAVLVLRDLEGLSYEEIAVVTEAPLGSVKGRLSRARQELIEILRRNTYDWGLPR
jgi:RNA polymerase sigma-70 factor (ECF subfamily)